MQKFCFYSTLLFLFIGISSFQQQESKEKLQWISLEEAEQKMKDDPRPLLIDLYTDWCGWCKVMDRKTYTSQDLIQYLNQNFYTVKLDAETKKEIKWKGKTYKFNPSYKTNEIALMLTNGQLSYPTTVIIPSVNDDPQPIAGMLEIKDMELVTTYFGSKNYGKLSFDSYARKYKPSWK
jgi:thioredoxin-related protein